MIFVENGPLARSQTEIDISPDWGVGVRVGVWVRIGGGVRVGTGVGVLLGPGVGVRVGVVGGFVGPTPPEFNVIVSGLAPL